jgi:hypothetical protein
MRVGKLLFVITFLVVMVCGCSNSKLVYSDNYVAGQDAQYGIINGYNGSIAEVNEGYYFLSGPGCSFLYYFDKEKKQAVPVCNKPNCLHADEPDSFKIANCSAYLGLMVSDLNYFEGALYYMTQEHSQNGFNYSINKTSLDGSKHQKILTLTEIPICIQVHRGYIYYSTTDSGTIAGQESTTKTTYRLYRFQLDKGGAKPEIIEEGTQIYGQAGNILCYGNSVYYLVHYYENSSLESAVSYINKYDIQRKTVSRILTGNSARFTVFNGKFVYVIYPQGTYTCDLDGNNPKKILDAYGIYSANDNYLFIDNYVQALIDKKDRELIMVDKNWKIINTISLKGVKAEPLGCTSEYYLVPQSDKSNEFGEIISLAYVPANKVADDMSPKSFYDFNPKVPFTGINTSK